MKKKTIIKLVTGVLCAALLPTSVVPAFAAGYEVIKEPWLDNVTGTKIMGDSEVELLLCPTSFINGLSIVYTDTWGKGGWGRPNKCSGGYYIIDESGNTSELKTDIDNTVFAYGNVASSYKGSGLIDTNIYNNFPKKCGFKVDAAPVNTSVGFSFIHTLVNELAVVFLSGDDNCGLIDKNDNIIVPFIYDEIVDVGHDGYTWILKDGKWGIIKVDTNPVSVKVNGKELSFDQIPLIINGRTLAPLRAIFEALGATVDWNDETQTIASSKGDTTVFMTIGKNEMDKNGEVIELDEAPQIVGERTLVPVRAIAEAFDCNVDWDSGTSTVMIEN